jgi:glyoxylase I family protein
MSCKDPLLVERFYTQHFGFHRARVAPVNGGQIVFIKSGDIYLEIFQAEQDLPVPAADKDGPHYPGWRHIAFQVDDIDAKLREMGNDAKITLGPLTFDQYIRGWRTVWISDPEGNIIEVTQGYLDEDNPPPLDA